MLVPQVLGSIRALFPSEAELAKALSVYGVMMGLAASIGQFAGGALVEWSPFDLGWRTVFLAKLPIGIPVMPRRLGYDAGDQRSRRQRLDIGGAVLISLALALPRAAAVRGPPAGLARLDVRHAGRGAVPRRRLPVVRGPADRARRQSAARPRPAARSPASAAACWSARCSSSPPPSTCCSPSTSRRATAPIRCTPASPSCPTASACSSAPWSPRRWPGCARGC